MQVDRVFHVRIVYEAYDALRTARYDEGRTRGNPIIAYQPCGTKVGVDGFGEWLDLHLVVENVLTGDGVDDCPRNG